MANTFALTLKAQNNHPATSVIGAVTHQIPDQSERDTTGFQSATFEITGTSASNSIAIGAAGIVTTSLAGAGAVTQINPMGTGNLAVTNFRGVFLTCDRADDDTAPGVAGSSSSNASTTSLAIGTGSKAFTVSSSLGYVAGQRVRAVSATGSGANWMEGVVATYATTTLTVTVDVVGGSGTLADWTIYAIPAAQVTSTGFGFYTAATAATPITLFEGSSLALFKGAGTALVSANQFKTLAVSGQTLTVSLAGTTGLKVSVLAVFDAAA